MAPGERNTFGALMFELEIFRKQICCWRKYLWYCEDFSATPQWFGARVIVPSPIVTPLSAVCFFQPILQLSKESSWPSLWLRFLYLHASGVHQHTFNRSPAATLTPEVRLQNLRACRRGSCPSLERLVDLRNW